MDTSDIVTVPTGEPFKARTGIGRSQQYELIAKGELDSVLVGRRRLILMESFLRYIDRLREREAAGIGRVASPNPKAKRSALDLVPGPTATSSSTAQSRRIPLALAGRSTVRRE
jgi:hypothetical protein